MAMFDEEDLERTIAEVEGRLQDGANATVLLRELIGSLRDYQMRVHEEISDLTDRQTGLEKGLILLATSLERQARRQRGFRKSLAQVTASALVKSHVLLPAPAPVRTTVPSLGLEDQARRGLLAKGILNLFGSRGGHPLPYNGKLASRLMLKGAMSQKEHRVWKVSNRVSDAAWERIEAQRRAG